MKKYRFFEAFCSLLVVGLGQVIKGEGKKGLIMLLNFYLTLPALLYTSLVINETIFMLALPAVVVLSLCLWLYNIFDALTK